MLIAGVLCLCAAVVVAARALWTLTRASRTDPAQLALRAVAPTQLAAAGMLAAGGAAALGAPPQTAVVVVIVSVTGAVGTVATGVWQSARYAARRQPTPSCAGSCATCIQPCA